MITYRATHYKVTIASRASHYNVTIASPATHYNVMIASPATHYNVMIAYDAMMFCSWPIEAVCLELPCRRVQLLHGAGAEGDRWDAMLP